MSATLATQQREFARELFGEREPRTAGAAVYRSSVLANHRGALAATYPSVARLVGEVFFTAAAWRFALANASTSGDLGEYGGQFPRFLADYAPAASLPYLADVARLEWACHECERAAEPPAFDFAALSRVPAGRYGELCFTLHPAVRLVASPHPVVAIHEANAPQRDGTPSRMEGPDYALVRRVDSRARVECVPATEWQFLDAISRGESLARATARLSSQDAEGFLAQALARYVDLRIVCGFTAP